MSRPARDRATQQPPPTSLSGFPTLVRRRRRLWRAGRSAHANPWWFDGSGAGRFDPIGTGQGTCYPGTDRLAGLLKCSARKWPGAPCTSMTSPPAVCTPSTLHTCPP